MNITTANLDDATHASALIHVLDSYASDPVGGGKPLSVDVRMRLVPELKAQPNAVIVLAFDGETPVGLAVCFMGFSTFKARPLLNIHDLAVVPEYRGRGVGRSLLAFVERYARERACCKLTLEVQDANARARGLYRSFGFTDFVVGEEAATRFLEKPL